LEKKLKDNFKSWQILFEFFSVV